MPMFFRMVKSNLDWGPPDPKAYPWLKAGEIQANPLSRDMATQANSLSLYEIKADSSNLDEVLMGLAAKRQRIQNLDYVLFDFHLPGRLGIRYTKTQGHSASSLVNDQYHWDLEELSGETLLRLTREILNAGTPARCLKKRIENLVRTGLSNSLIDRDLMEQCLREELGY